MAKNHMKEVAKLLGVELNEKFTIKGQWFNSYCLTERGLVNSRGSVYPITLDYLLIGEYEIEKNILDKVEREYLLNIIKPKQIYEQVCYIEKCCWGDGYYICIGLNNRRIIGLPIFNNKEMYKGMEPRKMYSLKELGLDIYG